MMLTASIDGDGFKSIVRIAGKIDAETKKIVRATTAEAKRAMLASLQGPRAGRIYEEGTSTPRYRLGRSIMGRRRLERYRAKVRKGVHQSSAAGQPPARLTGTLIRSIRARATRSRRGDFVMVIYADRRTAFYRHFLEFGTQGGLRGSFRIHRQGGIAPRPFIAPIQQKFVDILFRRLGSGVGRAIEEGAK